MTADAGNAESDELPGRRAFMAVITLQRRVRADQREPIQVILNGTCVNLPPVYGMTIFACCAHLTPMDVGMAISAVLTDVTKYFFHMARTTLYILVQST